MFWLVVGLHLIIYGTLSLTHRGKVYVNQSLRAENISETFALLEAPRTTIGAHSNGSLYLVQVRHSDPGSVATGTGQ